MGTRGRVSVYCCKTGLWTHYFIPRDALAILERLRAAAGSAAAAVAALPALVEAGRLDAAHFGPPSTVAIAHAECWPFIEYSVVISSIVGPILEVTPTGFALVPPPAPTPAAARAILRTARGGWTGDPYLFPDDGKGPTGWVDKRYARPPPRARACAHPDCAGGAVWVADDDEFAVPCETYGVVCAAHAICIHCNASRVLFGEEGCQRCCP